MTTLRDRIQRDLEGVGIHAAIEIDRRTVVVSGMVESDTERETAAEIIADLAPDYDLEDNLLVSGILPEQIQGDRLSELDLGTYRGADTMTQDDESLEPGDFTDQHVLTDPFTASGPSGTAVDEDIGEGDDVYIPPIDPVRDRNGEFLGGFGTSSMDSLEVEHSALDGEIGDEALAEAVRRELREDAATSELEIEVEADNCIVHLSGSVRDIEDVENVEEVVSRLPAVLDIREELRVENI